MSARPAFFPSGVVVVAPSLAALVAARLLRGALEGSAGVWQAETCAEVAELARALERAGLAWEQSVSADGHGSTACGGEGALSSHVSIDEAARMLNVGERHARRLVAHAARKVGRVWVVERAAVMAIAEERRRAS